MFKVSITENQSVKDLYNTEVFIDSGIETFAITDSEAQEIIDSERMDFWQYKNGSIVVSEFKPEILKAIHNKEMEQLRLVAYEKESDPIFFKIQRGEATQEEWLIKIEEIKLRYPYEE